MKKCLLPVLLLSALLLLAGCSGDHKVAVEGVPIVLEETTVQELVDLGFQVTQVHVPKTLYSYGDDTRNSMDVYLEKDGCAMRVKSVIWVGDIYGTNAEILKKNASTEGVIRSMRITLNEGPIVDGSYKGTAFSDITRDTISKWKCREREEQESGRVLYKTKEKRRSVSVSLLVEENPDTGEIEELVCLWLRWVG